MYSLSLFIGLIGIVLSWILIFIFYSAIDTLESTLGTQIDAASTTMLQVQQTVDSTGAEIIAVNTTLVSFETSLTSIQGSLNQTGNVLSDLGLALRFTGGLNLGSFADSFASAGTDLKNSATEIGNTKNTFAAHRKNLADTSSKINGISQALGTQRSKLVGIKGSVSSLFSSLKLAILLLVILIDMAFLMLGINSIAGLLD